MKTKGVYAEIPFSALSYGYVMDEAGSATVSIPIGVPKVDGSSLTPDDLFPVITGVAIERDGSLMWGGLLWAYRLNLTTRTIEITAKGYLSYYAYRNTGVNGVTYKNIEQTQMIRNLITSITDGIDTDHSGMTPTNMVRTRTWIKYEFKSLADVFADLADDVTALNMSTGTYGGGFFLYMDPYWVSDGKTIGNRIYNTPNRHPYDSGVSLQQSVNCEFSELSVDGTELATNVYAVGATDGTASLTPYASDSNPALLSRIPHVNEILSESSIKQTTALQYKVRSALRYQAAPIIQPTASTYPGLFSPLSLRPGMSVGVTTDDGFLNLVADDYTVTETVVSVATDGSDRLTLSLVQTSLFKETEN
ncbi:MULTISPECIES: hypothetical protein [unclassified Streptomyces]|uniref:hypothetical protein n=1 Tax=Streptomyces sp. NPDC056835 TaxID=3345956 RepID=UPI003697331F